MERRKLKKGGACRKKALFGEAISAGATLAAAAMQVAATQAAAKEQSKAMIENAKTQAQTLTEQINNDSNLQKESMAFTKQQNKENRDFQRDVMMNIQMQAAGDNMDAKMERNKMQAKAGKRIKLKSVGKTPFKVTDGGGVIPLSIDSNGYGIYEIYGNDHEHYHKTPGGKNKSGVGIKFPNGKVVEGEGNQNTNQGELLYVTPQDAVFISKHNINGFNPALAVKNGLNPVDAYNIQEYNKALKGIDDDGSKVSPYNPLNRIQLKCGGRRKAAKGGFFSVNNPWAGPTINALGNMGGATISTFGNMLAANRLGKAYREAGDIIADAYSQWHGIDMNEIKKNEFKSTPALAVMRSADTNINPQLERIQRDAAARVRETNRGTLSSAARQARLASIQDTSAQRSGEQYAYAHNENEKIRQENAKRATEVMGENAYREVLANKDYTSNRLSLLQYNNDINNAKIAGIGQARADAAVQSSAAKAQGLQNSLNAFGSALASSGQGYATSLENYRKELSDFTNSWQGLGNEDKITAAILRYKQTGDKSFINSLLQSNTISQSARMDLLDALNEKNSLSIFGNTQNTLDIAHFM